MAEEYAGSVYADEKNILESTVEPIDASNRYVRYTVKDPGTSGAYIENFNELNVTAPGDVTLTATIINGDTGRVDFEKDVKFRAYGARVPVTGAELTISEWDPHPINGRATRLEVSVYPDTATERNYTLKLIDPGPANVKFDEATQMISSTPSEMTYEMGTVQAGFEIRIHNGIAKNVDYVTNVYLRITARVPEEIFVPITDLQMTFPSPLRALYPILVKQSAELFPWNCSAKDIQFETIREGEDGYCNCIMYEPSEYELENDVLSDFFDWEKENEIYLFPWSAGKNKLKATIENGDSTDHEDIYCLDTIDYVKEFDLEFQDPYIPVKDVINVPTEIRVGEEFDLNTMELSTEGGLNFYNPYWDEEEPTYKDIQWRIGSDYYDEGEHPNTAEATISDGHIVTPKKTGQFTVQCYVENGTKEPIQWYDKEQVGEPFTKLITINVVDGEDDEHDTFVTLKLTSGSSVKVSTHGDFSKLCTTSPADSQITIGRTTFAKKDVMEVVFWDDEDDIDITCLWNFGRNFTSLTKVDRIPKEITGDNCLRNFLRGCTFFNQPIEIPETVDGDHALDYFLRDCTSFNSTITIVPEDLHGNYCMHGFLYGCTSFNKPIELPRIIYGMGCLERFMYGCKMFNQDLAISEYVCGPYCLRRFMAECTSFNRPITLPNDVGNTMYEMNGFMYNCDAMVSEITVPAGTGEHASISELTLATQHIDAPLHNQGATITGDGASAFMEKIVNSSDYPPYVNIKIKE